MKALSLIKQCIAETLGEGFASGRSSPPRHSTVNPKLEKSYDLGWTWGRFSRENLDRPLQTALHAGPSEEQQAYSSGYADGYAGIYKNIYKQNARENPHAQHESISNPSPKRQVGSVYVKSGQYAGKTVYAFEDETKGLYYTYNMDTGTAVCIGDASNLLFQSKPTINFIKESKTSQLVKECVLEVLKENLSEPKKSWRDDPAWINHQKMMARMKAYSELCKRIKELQASGENPEELATLIHQQRSEAPWARSVLNAAGYGVQGGMYMRESGFDPQSQAGPNVPMENPYPEWNSQMAKMEEDTATNPHGREAQDAGAGQFDPRTFGPVAESAIQWKCPHCKHDAKIPFQTFKGKPSGIHESKKKSLK
jgi:hypothetical protein